MAANLSRLLNTSLFLSKNIERPTGYLCRLCLTHQYCRNLHTTDSSFGGRLKSEWRRKRVPALTKLSLDKPEKFKSRKAYGGGRKTKITRANNGLYLWKSQDVQFQSLILDVISNTAHKDFTENKIMVKGSIVEVDAEKFKKWFEKESGAEMTKENRDTDNIEEAVLRQIKDGKVLAKVSSRPGQDGCVNGYLLEGEELQRFMVSNNSTTDES